MVAVRLTGIVDDDGQLIIKVPENIPPGVVDLVIQIPETDLSAPVNLAREAARTKLAAAGLVSSARYLPSDIHIPTDAEVRAAGKLPPSARPSEELIDEDREDRV